MVPRMLIMHIAAVLWPLNLLLATSFDKRFPNALPGCQDLCGSVTIYYPFGIGSKCFFDKWFEIDCRVDSTGFYMPYLKSISLEVREIELYTNKLRIVIPLNFSYYTNTGVSSYDLRGTPFSYSSSVNSFVGIGCNIIAYLSNLDYDDGAWCARICDLEDDENHDLYNSSSGCMTELQQNIHTLEPVILSTVQNEPIMSNSTRDQKTATGFGFLATRDWVLSFASEYGKPTKLYFNLVMDEVAVFLDWELFNVTLASFKANKVTTSCKFKEQWLKLNNSFYKNSMLQCSCRSDYGGNPYLPNGCVSYLHSKDPWIDVKHVKKGAICLIGVLFFIFLVWWLRKEVKKVNNSRMKNDYFIQNGGLLLQQQISSDNGSIEKTKVFNSYELNKATDNFNVDRVVGQGGQGTVYKGMLPDGKIIAVKKSKIVDMANIGQFINEVVILSQINHRNVVKLLGCCLETEVPLLVYEFIMNGTLSQLIHKSKEDFALTWEMRLRIGAEIAGALSYMHSAASMPIYHRDMKSTNILLDDKYKAIVSDFGISRSVDVDKTHFTTQVQGTFGYLDPEYFLSSQFTEKSDVYSFGVVLVELLTGHKPIFSNTSQEVKGLALHFVELMDQNKFLEMIDPQILEEGQIEEIIVVCQLAKMCLHMNGKRRPTMKKVAVQLEGILMSREKNTPDDNYDFIENSVIDLEESSDASSTSTGTWCKGITASSLDELPYVTYP